jgi:hypothetical protein
MKNQRLTFKDKQLRNLRCNSESMLPPALKNNSRYSDLVSSLFKVTYFGFEKDVSLDDKHISIIANSIAWYKSLSVIANQVNPLQILVSHHSSKKNNQITNLKSIYLFNDLICRHRPSAAPSDIS